MLGAIGGDQQIVFKRPYNEERSIQEAERILEEREALIAEYNATREAKPAAESTSGVPRLVDVDAVERAQSTTARNERDASRVRSLIETAAAQGFALTELTVTGRAYSPESNPDVSAQVTQDVTASALIGPGQYRKSLVDSSVEQFSIALGGVGLFVTDRDFCTGNFGNGEAHITITAIINHDNTTSEVGTYRKTACFTGQ